MPLMTQKAYAEKKGVTPQYIGKLVGQDKIRLVRDPKTGRMLVDSKKADKAVAETRERVGSRGKKKKSAPHSHRSTKRAGRPAEDPAQPHGRPSASRSLTASKAEREYYLALKAKLEYEESVQNLLPRQLVLDAQRKMNTNLRTRMRRLPRQLAPVLVRASSPAEIEKMLLQEIDLLLEELAADPLGEQVAVPAAPPEVVQASAMAVINPTTEISQ